MILAVSVITGMVTAVLSYRVLFYDSGDFWDGFGRFTAGLLHHRRRWFWQRGAPPPPPEYFEDDSWSSGLRFGLFLAISFGGAWFTYSQLHKHFD